MTESKKKIVAQVGEKEDESIEELVELMIVSLKDHRERILEPFELCEQKIHHEILTNSEKYRTKFSNGYKALITQLHEDQKIIPPKAP